MSFQESLTVNYHRTSDVLQHDVQGSWLQRPRVIWSATQRLIANYKRRYWQTLPGLIRSIVIEQKGSFDAGVPSARTEGKTYRPARGPVGDDGALCNDGTVVRPAGRSHCRNRHVTNSYLCYQCYWLPIRISLSFLRSFHPRPPRSPPTILPAPPPVSTATLSFFSAERPPPSFWPLSHSDLSGFALLQICEADNILYRIMGYVRGINYGIRDPRSPRGPVYKYICPPWLMLVN